MASGGFGGFQGNSASHANVPPVVEQDDEPAYVLDRPASNVQKMPISYLQEICIKRAIKPEYELLSTEGQVHEPTFMFRVTVNDLSAVGQGKSKKTAKHLAAKALLERIVAVGRYKEFGMGETQADAMETLHQLADISGTGARVSGGSGEEVAEPAAVAVAVAAPLTTSTGNDDGGEGGPGNPVGKLQELCGQKKYPAPTYECIGEEGMPHERVFIIRITLGKFTAEGSARNKKLAKRQAAEKLLKFLESMPAESQRENIGLAEEDELAETGGGQAIIQQPFADMEEGFMNMGLSENTLIVDGDKCGLKTLGELKLVNEQPSMKHIYLLKLIGDEENWEPTYYSLPRRSKADGDYQCLVQLNAMPVAVCFGRGATAEEAQQAAALNALEYLKIMTKN